MATSYPSAVDDGTTLPNPSGNAFQNNPDHGSLHSNENDAIKALETKVGTGASTPAANLLLLGTGAGTTAWTQLTSAQLRAILSDETGTGTAVFATSPTITTPTLITPKVDTIAENTANNGVIVDGVLLKDGVIDSAALLNKVNTNALQSQVVTAPKVDFGGSGAGIWWEEIGRTTLSTAGDTITVSSIPARKYLQLRMFLLATGGTIDCNYRFNGDSANNYSFTIVVHDGNALSTVVSTGAIACETGTVNANDYEVVIADVLNISNRVKSVTQRTQETTVAASVAPVPTDIWGSWVNTTTQINSITLTNTGTGDLAIGSEIIVLGHDD